MKVKVFVVIKRYEPTNEFVSLCCSFRNMSDAVSHVDELNSLHDGYIYSYYDTYLI